MSADHPLLKPKFPGQRRILSLDGGGIRGILTLGMLENLEARLRTELRRSEDFRLCDYFDFIGGTSTGAIIAAGLALGMPVSEIIELYKNSGRLMFTKQRLLQKHKSMYQRGPLAQKLQQVFGAQRLLGDKGLHCLLLLMLRNAETDSPWPVTNNPQAKYNARERADCNLDLPLWQMVRGSTAAPIYFGPEVITLGRRRFAFVDGGVTPYNNPAFQMYRLATLPPYKLGWATEERKLLVLSFGTGQSASTGASADNPDRNLVQNAISIPSELMSGMAYDQDINCRSIGRCVFGAELDREVGDLVVSPVEKTNRHFTYARYNPSLTRKDLDALGFANCNIDAVSKLDAVDQTENLLAIGMAYGERFILPRDHFAGFLEG